MLRFLLFMVLFGISLTAESQNQTPNPDVILLNEQVNYVLHHNLTATKFVSRKYKVFNQQGLYHAQLSVGYDSFSSIDEISISVWDTTGNELTTKKQKEIYDQSTNYGASVYDDDRVKRSRIFVSHYPVLVEYSYIKDYKEFYGFNSWMPQSSPKIRVDYALYVIQYPKGVELKYRMFNIEEEPTEITNTDPQKLIFKVRNIPNYEPEPFSPPSWEKTPTVYVMQDKFKYHEHRGSRASWESYGAWMASLNDGRDELPQKLKIEVNKIVSGCSDTTEMVRKIYQYVQNNTRYVSVQYGIGGLQAFSASEVYENGWGDCKALSNYTVSLLKAAGIKANYTIVKSGYEDRPMLPDFPIDQFNHVIVSVPMGEDTIWLECTSQQSPFNYLGYATSDRYALAIDGNNSTLVKTPEYDSETNKTTNIVSIKLDELGGAETDFSLIASGVEYERYGFLLIEDEAEQEKWILENIDVKSFELESFDVSKDYSDLPVMYLHLQLSIDKYASVSGKRMFIPLKIYDPLENIPESDKDRESEIYLEYSYIELDSVIFQIPLGYDFEYIPDSVNIETIFGTFYMSVSLTDNFITYRRSLKVNKGRFPASDYSKFVDFYKAIQKADKQQVVLVR